MYGSLYSTKVGPCPQGAYKIFFFTIRETTMGGERKNDQEKGVHSVQMKVLSFSWGGLRSVPRALQSRWVGGISGHKEHHRTKPFGGADRWDSDAGGVSWAWVPQDLILERGGKAMEGFEGREEVVELDLRADIHPANIFHLLCKHNANSKLAMAQLCPHCCSPGRNQMGL